ncbi:Vsp/OspC family lipoprotein [Borrelia hispanica]|uniref:Vsp/OspC family lipoprotein n=1 Tax=Borrelia hispanica TaxID=40835 RepID=UPI0004B33634|nr:Vsp/OspC family lipoprotein [Borrelia hispanica]
MEFAGKVKEVHTLVKSVDELAKAIGKKIKSDNNNFEAEANKTGSLVAGALQIVLTVKEKLGKLDAEATKFEEVNSKFTEAKGKIDEFVKKLKEGHAALGEHDAQDDDVKKAIDRIGQPNGDKGAKELGGLNKAIDELLRASNKIVSDAMAELVVKPTI